MKTRLKKFGNSKGIILSKSLLEKYKFEDEVEIVTQENGLLIIPIKVKPLEQWDELFKKAIKEGHIPESDLFEGIANDFDKDEWDVVVKYFNHSKIGL